MKFDDLELNYSPYLPENRESTILDIGCGNGRVITYLLSKGYSNVIGIDRNATVLRSMDSKLTCHTILISDLLKFLLDNPEKFDLTIAKDVLYYIPKSLLPQTLSALRCSLKPNGRLIVETFNGAAFTGPYVFYKDYQIEWIPTEHSIRAMLDNSGFLVHKVSAFLTPSGGFKKKLFLLFQRIWQNVLRMLYFLERGLDEQNPRILTTRLIVIAHS